jgi:chaperonin GroES
MIQAIGDKIIVKLLKREMSQGGILLPVNSADPQGYGKVISVGEKVESVKKGDVIVFHVRGGMDMLMEKNVMRTISEGEVYGILIDEAFLKNLADMTIKE